MEELNPRVKHIVGADKQFTVGISKKFVSRITCNIQ